MAISDVLFEAVDSVEWYLVDDGYGGPIREEIDEVVKAMTRLRLRLDYGHVDGFEDKLDAALAEHLQDAKTRATEKYRQDMAQHDAETAQYAKERQQATLV